MQIYRCFLIDNIMFLKKGNKLVNKNLNNRL